MDDPQNNELIIFGATGGTGQAIVRVALERGYRITAFVRDIERARRLYNGGADHGSQLAFTQGDALNEPDIRRAIGGDLHAVISAMGIYQRSAGGDDLTRATQHLIGAMRASGPRRLLCVSSLGVGDSRMQGDWLTRMIQKTTLKHTLADKECQETAIRNSDLDWTILRPSRLIDKGGLSNIQTWTGAQPAAKLGWAIRRSLVAEFTLDCLENNASIHQALNITGKK
jgi:uncharacterized protein YbjT (DUF2867 family)